MTDNPFQSPNDEKLEIVSINSTTWLSDEDVKIDFSVGYLVPDRDAPPIEPVSEAEAVILRDATPLKPEVLSRHILMFKEVMRLDVFDTESRFMNDFAGPWTKFQRLSETIPGIAISDQSNYLDSMKYCDLLWDRDVAIFHTHITTFGSAVINVLSWDRPVIVNHPGESNAH